MKEVKGDFWKFAKYADAICVTTNGVLDRSENIVMGAGLALAFKQKYPWLPASIGRHVKIHGNTPCLFQSETGPIIISFPTKNDWKNPSTLDLIERSAIAVVKLIDGEQSISKVLTVPPGCGLGGLNYSSQVRPLLMKIFDDRFCVVISK